MKESDLSPTYSLCPGHASKRSAVEAVMKMGGVADRGAAWVIVVGPVLVFAPCVLGFPFGVMLSLGLLCTAPFAASAWHERRLHRATTRIRSQRLCLGCTYPLLGASTSEDGFGVCPECGRRFHVSAYHQVLPPRGTVDRVPTERRLIDSRRLAVFVALMIVLAVLAILLPLVYAT